MLVKEITNNVKCTDRQDALTIARKLVRDTKISNYNIKNPHLKIYACELYIEICINNNLM